jgi:hypothetical protein
VNEIGVAPEASKLAWFSITGEPMQSPLCCIPVHESPKT